MVERIGDVNIACGVESDIEGAVHLARRRGAAPSLEESDGQGLLFVLAARSEQPDGRGAKQ